MSFSTHIYCMRWVPKEIKNAGNNYFSISSAFVHQLLSGMTGSTVKVLLALAELQRSDAPHFVKASYKKIRGIAGVSQHTFERALDELARTGLITVSKGSIQLHVLKSEELKTTCLDFKNCWRCGIEEPQLLQPYYFDGNGRNKDKGNVCFLCPTCISKLRLMNPPLAGPEQTWKIRSHEDGTQKMLPNVAKNATGVETIAAQSSSSSYLYKEDETKSEKDKEDEKTSHDSPPLGVPEMPAFISNPNQLIEYEQAKATAECRELFESQMFKARTLRNPVPKRSYFTKVELPESLIPSWTPEGQEDLFARTVLLQAMDFPRFPRHPTRVNGKIGDQYGKRAIYRGIPS